MQDVEDQSAEIERLRARCHRIAEKRDLEYARDMRAYRRLKGAVETARERTRDWKPDWTDVETGPYGWWRFTSHNHVMEATALVADRMRAEERREGMERGLRLLVKELGEKDGHALDVIFSGDLPRGIAARLQGILDIANREDAP